MCYTSKPARRRVGFLIPRNAFVFVFFVDIGSILEDPLLCRSCISKSGEGFLEFQREVHRCRCPHYLLSFLSRAFILIVFVYKRTYFPRPTWSSFVTTFSICDIAGANTPSFVCSVVVCGGGSISQNLLRWSSRLFIFDSIQYVFVRLFVVPKQMQKSFVEFS